MGERRSGLRLWHVVVLALLPTLALTSFFAPALPGPPGWGVLVWWAPGISGLLFMILPLYLILGAAFALSALLAQDKAERRQRQMLAVAFLVGLALAFSLLRPAAACRMSLIRRTPDRLRPLILALERYWEDRQSYPTSLQELVPRYLGRLPSTGMIGYARLRYELVDQEKEWRKRPETAGQEYHLSVPCAWGTSFDSLNYWPSKRYPPQKWGGAIERIDGWAYVHE